MHWGTFSPNWALSALNELHFCSRGNRGTNRPEIASTQYNILCVNEPKHHNPWTWLDRWLSLLQTSFTHIRFRVILLAWRTGNCKFHNRSSPVQIAFRFVLHRWVRADYVLPLWNMQKAVKCILSLNLPRLQLILCRLCVSFVKHAKGCKMHSVLEST